MIRSRHLASILVVLFVGSMGWYLYGYFFDCTQPTLTLSGLQDGQYCCGDAQCEVSADKSGELSVRLDGQPLINKFKIGRRGKEYPFTIPTTTIANGKHTLKLEFKDGRFNRNKQEIERTFYVDNVPLQAAFIKSDSENKVFQGRTLHVQLQVNKEVKEATITALAKTYKFVPETQHSSIYECFIPVDCEEKPNEYLFNVEITDMVGNTLNLDNKFQVVAYPFKKTTLELDEKKVAQEKELGRSIDEREMVFAELAEKSPQEKLWKGEFCTPIDIKQVTCDFGTIRTTQHKGRYAHKALDVISMPRCMVWSTQDGVVVLKDRFVDSGNTVVVDHGLGVLSMFYHLEDFANVQPGQKVAKGSPLGTMGKTGYAKGYHLHWEMRVNNIAVDPMQWTKTNF